LKCLYQARKGFTPPDLIEVHFNQIWRSKTFPGLVQTLQSNLAE
jgi:hypothetical protein